MHLQNYLNRWKRAQEFDVEQQHKTINKHLRFIKETRDSLSIKNVFENAFMQI